MAVLVCWGLWKDRGSIVRPPVLVCKVPLVYLCPVQRVPSLELARFGLLDECAGLFARGGGPVRDSCGHADLRETERSENGGFSGHDSELRVRRHFAPVGLLLVDELAEHGVHSWVKTLDFAVRHRVIAR